MSELDAVSVLPMYQCLGSVDLVGGTNGDVMNDKNAVRSNVDSEPVSVNVREVLHNAMVQNADTLHSSVHVGGDLHDISVLSVGKKENDLTAALLHDAIDIDIKMLQGEDQSLRTYFRAVEDPGSGFIIKDELLYRVTSISGFEIAQLLVPSEKRLQVIQLSHDSLYSGHYGVRKTIQRIQTQF